MEAIRSIRLDSYIIPLTPAFSQASLELAKKVALAVAVFFAILSSGLILRSFVLTITERFSTKPSADNSIAAYGTNLTTLYTEGKLEAAIERTKELKQLTSALLRKENCLLLGDPGVGKSALIARLIKEIAENPEHPLKGKRLIELDPVSLLADTQWQGQLEKKFQNLVSSLGKDDILVIDNMYMAMSGGYKNNPFILSAMFSPIFEKKKIQCIATSKPKHYKQLENNYLDLVKQFTTIHIQPLPSNESCKILLALKPLYEGTYKCHLEDNVIEQAVRLCEQYFPQQPVLDRAIAVIKQACFKASEAASTTDLPDTQPLVDTAMIETVVTDLSGIPITKTTDEEIENLLQIQETLNKKVLGQKQAVESICPVLFRSRFGFNDPDRPQGFMLFAGPTGVGKTSLAQEFAHLSKRKLLVLNMGEFQEPNSIISRLIGSPPGYENHAEGGQLTEQVRLHPTSIILLDEIEKAHPNIFKILLAIAGQGETSDSAGKKINFRNTIIIMTSNLGANLAHLNSINTEDNIGVHYNDMCDNINLAIKQHFAPEFINRLTDCVIFNLMARETMSQLVDLEINKANERLKNASISISLDEQAKKLLIVKGYDITMGARPLTRAVKTYLIDAIVKMIMKKNPLLNKTPENGLVALKCSADNDVIVFS